MPYPRFVRIFAIFKEKTAEILWICSAPHHLTPDQAACQPQFEHYSVHCRVQSMRFRFDAAQTAYKLRSSVSMCGHASDARCNWPGSFGSLLLLFRLVHTFLQKTSFCAWSVSYWNFWVFLWPCLCLSDRSATPDSPLLVIVGRLVSFHWTPAAAFALQRRGYPQALLSDMPYPHGSG